LAAPNAGGFSFFFALLTGIPVVFNTPVDNSVEIEESRKLSD
jgi:hypothetical protein